MRLRLTNADDEYEIPTGWTVRFGSYKWRNNRKPRYSQDGVTNAADGRVSSRSIAFSHQMASGDVSDYGTEVPIGETADQTKDAEYRRKVNEIIAFFREGAGPWYLVDDDAKLGEGLRCEIEPNEYVDNPTGPIYRVSQNTLDLEMIGGHWEDVTETIAQEDGLSNGGSITVVNPSPLPVYCLITIAALNTAEEITVTNGRNSQFFTFVDTTFGSGSTLEVDATDKEFRCELNGVEKGFALADGSGPILLEPGTNTLEITSPSGIFNISVAFRGKYPI